MFVNSVLFCVSYLVILVVCHPTVYRMKENNILEPDLVAVSSTVIPLPSFEIGYGANVSHGHKYHKFAHRQGSKLVTDENKKKYYYGEKKLPIDLKQKSQ